MTVRSGRRSALHHPYIPAAVSCILLLCGCGAVTPRQVRVGIICGSPANVGTIDGFKTRLSELGYGEGKGIIYDVRTFTEDVEGEKRAARELVDAKVNLIFAFPLNTALAAKETAKGTRIPVVFAWSDLDKDKLFDSVAKPGGNITGVRYSAFDMVVKRLELLHSLVPAARRIWVVNIPSLGTRLDFTELLKPIAEEMGLLLTVSIVSGLDDLKAEAGRRDALAHVAFDAIMLMPQPITGTPEGFAVMEGFAERHRLPMAVQSPWQVEKGGLFCYTPDSVDAGRMAADLADKILKGTSAGTIPVPSIEGKLQINLTRAEALGLEVPEGLLKRADKVIR